MGNTATIRRATGPGQMSAALQLSEAHNLQLKQKIAELETEILRLGQRKLLSHGQILSRGDTKLKVAHISRDCLTCVNAETARPCELHISDLKDCQDATP